MASLQDSGVPNPGNFAYLQGTRDPEYNFSRPQDNMFLDWEGWRFVTMPLNAPVWTTTAPSGAMTWLYPFYIQEYGDHPTASVDVCGITYIM